MAIKNTNTSPLLKEGANITLTQSGQVITIAANDTTNAPGGSDTQVQFNDGGNFGGDAGLTYNKTTNVLGVESIDFAQTPAAATAERRLKWDQDEGSLVLTLKGGNVTIPLGHEVVTLVYNAEATTLTKGTVVYAFGAQGQRISVKRAVNTSDSTSAQTIGVVAESIASGAEGWVMVQGMVRGLDTSAYVQGDALYLGATAGTYTKTKVYAPNHLVYVGIVVKVNASSGEIFVRCQNGYELDELHNVSAQSPSNNDGIFWNSSTNLWEKKSISTALGYTPAMASRMLTINGTSYDLTADRTWSVGTVTSVAALTLGTTGTDLSSSVANGTTTPVITLNVPTASAANRGALSSADWTTFNNKQNAITLTTTGTSGAATLIGSTLNIPQYSGGGGISGSGSSGQVTYWNGSSSVTGESNLFWDATNDRLGIGTNTSNAALSFGTGVIDNKIYLYDGSNDKYGFGVRPAELLIYSGAAGDANISFGKYNGTTFTPYGKFTGNGHFLINTTTSTGEYFRVNGSGSFSDRLGIGITSDTNYPLIVQRTNAGNIIEAVNTTTFSQIRLQSGGTNQNSYLTLNPTGTGSGIIQLNNSDKVKITSSGIALNGTGAANNNIYNWSITSDIDTNWGFRVSNATTNKYFTDVFGAFNDGTNRGFRVINKNGATENVLMFVTSDGNLLINTTTDAGYKLDVNGTGRFQDNLTISDSKNIILGTTSGTKIGTTTSEKLGFWNTNPIVQPTTSVTEAIFTENSGTTINDNSTFDGYTIQQVVKALRNAGLLA